MPRDEQIEALLAAWFELRHCARSEKAKWLDQRDALIDRAIHGTRSSRQELLEALWPRFREYQLARRREHQEKMAQLLRKS